jgi:hypothetical protein
MAVDPTFDGTGLRVLTLQEIRDNMRESIRLNPELGPSVSTGDYSVVGMLIDAAAAEMADIYDLDEAIYQGWDPDSATGNQLDNLGTIAGLTRQAATRSTGTLTLGGTPTTPVPSGSRARIPSGELVRTRADAVIGGGGTVDVAAEAVNTGPLDFAAGSITEIVDAVFGWSTVTNAADFLRGDPQETDSQYRQRRARSLAAGGSSTDAAIRARLEDLDDVEAAVAYSNRTLSTDIYGVPGKTLWVIVHPNTVAPAVIAFQLWGPAGVPSGIGTHGSQQATITDERGYSQIVRWDWATTVQIWITATLTTNADYPSGGDDLVKAAIVDYGATLTVSQDIEPQPIDTYVGNEVPGIAKLVITLSRTGVPGPGDTDPIPMAINELGTIALGDVSVVST